ncbi:hypothetical protein [Grimontia sp. NTOU-MAR1]|uniref:hypothetical protein n=1 Tax=Grimontia sp. NTOU-MAR1 TaxID=3111011 RepID=UPI002DB958AF|nr:hypothetical protein [Grimontia sp. NTOU-MAR1]WRV98793.1 hypothetical protein VP504_05030 [Grimontia sp. NTOU-MAR1]
MQIRRRVNVQKITKQLVLKFNFIGRKQMDKNTPFFSNFIEADTITKEEANQISGGWIFPNEIATRKAPSDDDEGFFFPTDELPALPPLS